jgi:hypothetical protein
MVLVKMTLITRPKCCDDKSLALATKDELIADIVIRRGIICNIKKTRGLLGVVEMHRQKGWIKILAKELESRYVVDM